MEILLYPDPRLTFPNKPLGTWSAAAQAQVEEMRLVLSRTNGAGLAAPQVGWNVQLFILSISGKEGETRERVVFDPVMTPIGENVSMEEGCLSFPDMWATIQRFDRVQLVGKTPEGLLDEILIGFEAQAVQHEMDHLAGILYIEKMTPADRQKNALAIRQLEENWHRRRSKG
jgi:peptide deformylase